MFILITGCSTEPGIQIRYDAEKLFHNAEKLFEKASIKPNPDDIQTWSQVKSAYLAVTDYCWLHIDSLSPEKNLKERKEIQSLAYMSVNRLTQLYFAEKKYDSAVLIVNQLLNFTELEGTQLLGAQLNLARSYHWVGNHDTAIDIYHRLVDTFYPPVDNNNRILTQVLNLPLEIIRLHRMLGNVEAVTQESESAITYFKRMISEWPNSALETAARTNLARLYTDDGRFQEAVDLLVEIKDSTGAPDFEAQMVIANITATGLKKYSKAIAMFDELMTRTDDTMRLPGLMFRKGVTYYDDGQYEKCRIIMKDIEDNYETYFYRDSRPRKYMAMTFDKENRWKQAEVEYLRLIDDYPATEDAFNAYLDIAEHHEKAKNDKLAELWYRRAVEFYDKMAKNYSETQVEASAIAFKADIARRNKEWGKAVSLLTELYDKFPETEIGQKALINAAGVYRQHLDKAEKADSLLAMLQNRLAPPEQYKNIDAITDDNK
jgi:tetratricopeptide (TPR) repeat protein